MKYNMTKILDYKEVRLEKRMSAVEKILNDRDEQGMNEFERYFDSRFKCELSSKDGLSEDNHYCKSLEQLADYLLGSEEVREDRKSQEQQYRFYVDRKEFESRTKKETLIEGMSNKAKNKNGFEDTDSIIDYLIKKDNFLKPKIQKITKQDLEKDDYCGKVLREYKKYDDYLSVLLMFPTNGEGYKIRRIKGSIKDDMIYTKDSLNGVFGYKLRHAVSSDCTPTWSMFDWSNQDHVKALIYIQREFAPDDDLTLILLDLDRLMKMSIKHGYFTEREIEVYSMIRSGYKNIEIAEELGLYKTRISNLVNAITTKICAIAKANGYN